MENFPLTNTALTIATEPVVASNSKFVNEPQAQSNGRDVGEQDVRKNMIPPAFSEVRQFVLRWKLNYFVKKLPKVQDVGVSDDKRRENPVAPVDKEVVVHVIPQILECEFAIIVVGMHAFANNLIEVRIKEL